MFFTSRVTKVIDIPQEPGVTVTIRKLAGRHLAKAQRQSQLEAVDYVKTMGGAAVVKEMQSLSSSDVAKAVKADPLMLYDKQTLLQSGIVEWSLTEERTPDAFEDIDDDIATYLAKEILRLAKPSLFQTPAEQETELKNGLSGSIVH